MLLWLGLGSAGLAQPAATAHPLVARYTLALPEGARAWVEFGPDLDYGLRTAASVGAPSILVAGMKATTTYHMRAVAELPGGQRWTDSDQVFTTGALPLARLPEIRITRGPLPPTPGVEMLNLVPIPYPPTKESIQGTPPITTVVSDLDGNVVWYYDQQDWSLPTPVRLLPNGHLLALLVKYMMPEPDARLRELDLTGATVRELTTQELNRRLAAAGFNLKLYEFHHEVLPLENGHLMLLADMECGPRKLMGDALIELDEDWKPVWIWRAIDHLDPRRHPMGLPDWTHGNALAVTPDDGNLLLSLRHQHWIVKIDHARGKGTGRVLWRLGPRGDFQLESRNPAEWFYAQHVPVVLSGKAGVYELALFDNGNFRPVNLQGETWASRAIKLRVDEGQRTARVTWSKPLPWFCDACGGVAQLTPERFEYTAGWLVLGGQVGEVLDDGTEI